MKFLFGVAIAQALCLAAAIPTKGGSAAPVQGVRYLEADSDLVAEVERPVAKRGSDMALGLNYLEADPDLVAEVDRKVAKRGTAAALGPDYLEADSELIAEAD